jgi:hypothetical protein
LIALYRYVLAGTLLSQRYVPPVLVFLVALSVGTSSDSGPLLGSYAFCVGAVVACGTWLAIAVVNHEDPVQRQVVVTAAGSARRVLVATVAVALTGCLLLIAIGLVYPIATGHHTVTAGALLVGAIAQLAGAFVGVALGLPASRLVIRRFGIAMVIAVTGLLAVVLIRWISPVNPLVRLLSNADRPGDTVARLAVLTGWSAVLLAVSVITTQWLAGRRG